MQFIKKKGLLRHISCQCQKATLSFLTKSGTFPFFPSVVDVVRPEIISCRIDAWLGTLSWPWSGEGKRVPYPGPCWGTPSLLSVNC